MNFKEKKKNRIWEERMGGIERKGMNIKNKKNKKQNEKDKL